MAACAPPAGWPLPALVACAALVATAVVALAVLPRQRVPLREVAARRRARDAALAALAGTAAAAAAGGGAAPPRAAPAPGEGPPSETESAPPRARDSALVLRLDEVRKEDAALVGGKGASLGELASAGLPVPAGFCVTRAAFEKAKNGRPNDIAAVRSAVVAAYASLGNEHAAAGDALVAVRSSATCEDSEAASFAGQLESFLGMQGADQVWDAVEKCWDSLASQRVAAYNSARASAASDVACCVVVQNMVDAKSAGVLFTANPISGKRDEAVLSASWGLGEAVVADLVAPDTWVVDRESLSVLDRTISERKDRMVILDQDAQIGSRVVDVLPPERRAEPCLGDAQVRALVSLGNKVLELYEGSPRDIEWALARETKAADDQEADSSSCRLLLLQARPVTTKLEGVDPRDGEPTMNEFDSACRPSDWITTCNAQEMFPGAGTPLSISTFGRAANFSLQAMHYSFGVRDAIDEGEGVVAWFHGCQFLNMTNTLRLMCGGMVGASLAKENGEMSILGRVNTACSVEDIIAANSPRRANLFRRLLNGMRYAATSALAVPLRIPRLRARLDAVRALRLGAEDAAPRALWAALDDEIPHYLAQWADGVTVSSVSAAFTLAVMKLLCLGSPSMTAWSTEAVAEVSCLIASAASREDVAESCDAVQSLDAVVRDLARDRKRAQAMVAMDPNDLLAQLLRSCDGFVQVLERHGHRCVKEAELRTLEWAADPLPLVRQVQSGLRANLALAQGHRVKDVSAPSSVDEVLARHPHLLRLQRWLLRGAASMARAGVRNRELGKSLCVAFHTELKRGYRRLGAQMHAQGLLPDADLVFFFTHDELGRVVGALPASADDVARLRMRAIQRRRLLPAQERLAFKDLYQGLPAPLAETGFDEDQACAGGSITGTPVCTGVAQGPARVVRSLSEAHLMQPGEILICPQTDVGWTPFFSLASGLVTELGGLLSHGAVVAREYGLPCIVNVPQATRGFRTGQIVRMDGAKGTVVVVGPESVGHE